MKAQTAEIKGQTVEYSARESRKAGRPNLKLRNGKIIVTVPENSRVDPGQLLEDNPEWTLTHWKKAKEFRNQIPDRTLKEGGKINVLGENKNILVENQRSNTVNEEIRLAKHLVDQTGLKDQLEKALRSYAREIFENKASTYIGRIDADFDRVFIRDQTTRWGSCSGKGNLNFNWRLVLGPEHVLEYVVVHELVHLEHADHSDRFWRRVREIYPDYKKSDKWLSENSAKLVFDKNQD